MTEPTPTPEAEAIVQAMLQRLRDLQATGESEVVNRKITAGDGLQGGGTLTDDVTLSLTQQALDNLTRASNSVSAEALDEALQDYVTAQSAADTLAGYLRRADGYRVFVVPFTHPGHLSGTVDAPPLTMLAGGVIESVGLAVAEPGADLTATVAGRSFTLRGGETSSVHEHGGPVTEGGVLRLSLQSTGVRGVTVSVRLREEV